MADPYRILQVLPTAEQEVVNAAFRALALKYHPDKDPSGTAARRMAELNEAYAMLRDPAARKAYDATQKVESRSSSRPFGGYGTVASEPPPRASAAGTRLEFGRYAGWTLRDLARRDPDYLRWLSRHASGLRYRTEIYQILGRMGAPAA